MFALMPKIARWCLFMLEPNWVNTRVYALAQFWAACRMGPAPDGVLDVRHPPPSHQRFRMYSGLGARVGVRPAHVIHCSPLSLVCDKHLHCFMWLCSSTPFFRLIPLLTSLGLYHGHLLSVPIHRIVVTLTCIISFSYDDAYLNNLLRQCSIAVCSVPLANLLSNPLTSSMKSHASSGSSSSTSGRSTLPLQVVQLFSGGSRHD